MQNKPTFNVKDIVVFGSPVVLGLLFIGWRVRYWHGLISICAGLFVLCIYILSHIAVDSWTRKLPGSQAVSIIVISFALRLVIIFAISYVLYLFSEINLMLFLLAIAIGFTAVLAISIKNWL